MAGLSNQAREIDRFKGASEQHMSTAFSHDSVNNSRSVYHLGLFEDYRDDLALF